MNLGDGGNGEEGVRSVVNLSAGSCAQVLYTCLSNIPSCGTGICLQQQKRVASFFLHANHTRLFYEEVSLNTWLNLIALEEI